jgi:hypothetical protein
MFDIGDIYEVMAHSIGRSRREVPLVTRNGVTTWDGFHVMDGEEISRHKEQRCDGNKSKLCPCGCGYMVRNGWETIKGHGIGKSVAAEGNKT